MKLALQEYVGYNVHMGTSMTATEARKNFFTLLKLAKKPGMAVTIIHEGKPEVMMMSVEEFEGWMETLEIMSDPSLAKDLRKSLREVKRGKIKDTVDLDALQKKLKL